ncbi:MAG: archaemetzincin family Zn-dependent metalloprotease [Bacteroidales bacterium]|nr:archaemetzincin family Zn-dependent metalloprotease [Bacteroidales bacterium]MCF8349843.1 archaemetzincin family Zn-dependent metalloprotease [Bacteroidales bacterium]MCF8375561.1 archaemetzincin family Zn-dependent metalloprotease [Bacteroidales bacterium]MCF8399960.1 archaemetzincin family Zn-dependent metalloprotease [Bacteroidales bacterium]
MDHAEEKKILLITHGPMDEYFHGTLAEDIQKIYGFTIHFEERHLDLNAYYDPVRRQYNGNSIISYLHETTSATYMKTLGLFNVDLFIPILTYIFGQAIFKGNVGIVSTYRLRNEQYGLKQDTKLLFERLRKVIIHELGHSFGLVHCYDPSCVMRSSTYVEDIDQKDFGMCISCRDLIVKIINNLQTSTF